MKALFADNFHETLKAFDVPHAAIAVIKDEGIHAE